MPPDETTEEQKQQLPEDNGTPAQPAAPSPDTTSVTNDPVASAPTDSTLDDTHPATDSGVDQAQLNDEGVAGAAEAQEPNADSSVTGYTPPAGDDDSTPPNPTFTPPAEPAPEDGQDANPGEQPLA